MNNNTRLSEYRTKCPIKMSDGRIFTDYRPRCAVNADLMTDLSNNNMIKSSFKINKPVSVKRADVKLAIDENNYLYILCK